MGSSYSWQTTIHWCRQQKLLIWRMIVWWRFSDTWILKIAVANEWLRPAARDVNKRKFGSKNVRLCIFPSPVPGVFESDFIKVSNVKWCLQYLHCFGSSISNLMLRYRWWSVRSEYIHQYVNKYWADSLINISFEDKSWNYIIVVDCRLGNQLPSFPQWFPNVRVLKLFNVNMDMDVEMPSFIHKNDINLCHEFTSNLSVHFERLANEHSSLVQLDLAVYKIAVVAAISVIRQLKFIEEASPSNWKHCWFRIIDWCLDWMVNGSHL